MTRSDSDRARVFPAYLRQLPSRQRSPSSARLDLRNRLATLLYERVLRTRAAARFVFRRHSHVAREAASTYERRKRAAARKRQTAEQAASTESEVNQE